MTEQPADLLASRDDRTSGPNFSTGRRRFFRWLVHALNALVGAVFGVPALCYLFETRRGTGGPGDFRRVARLSEIRQNGTLSRTTGKRVYEVAVRDVRRDAWMIYPQEVLGRVWLVLDPSVPFNPDNPDSALKAFTSICPHLGCSISYHPGRDQFLCPCHTGTFDLQGSRVSGPPPRSMDWLELRLVRDPASSDHNPDYFIEVKYQSFWPEKSQRIPKA